MSIKYFANRVKESSTTSGAGNLVLGGPIAGYKSFISGIGSDKLLTYYIYRLDTSSEWEIGTGYIQVSGGVNILVRQSVVSSSNNNGFVTFSAGTKFIETVIGEDRVNSALLNVVEKSGNFTAEYMPATYIIDASTSGVQITLPSLTNETDPITIGFLLSKTSGNVYTQPNALLIYPSGSETINGSGVYDLTIKNDYVQILSMPNQSGWLILDPVQDSTNPYGNDGSIQVKYDGGFSGVNTFNWDFNNSSLLIGGTGTITSANIILPSASGSTVVFNEQSYPNDFRVEGSGNTHLLFIDGSENKIAINSSNANDSLYVNAQNGAGITVSRSGIGPKIILNNSSVSGLATNDIIGYVIFSGLNNSGNSLVYSKIYSTIEDNADGSESSSVNIDIYKNGSTEQVANLGPSGLSIGFDNSNIDGIIIGEICQNDGNNIVLGYYQNICGQNCVVLGHNSTLASGTFGGLIGISHSASGNNIWILGGSGVSVSGDNQTYLALDNNNHVSISKSGSLNYNTFSSGNQIVNIKNSYTLSSGINQLIHFGFVNNSGISKTGLILGSRIFDVSNNSEDTELVAKILSNGSTVNILSINTDSIVIGDSSVSGNNMVFSIDSNISGVNNAIFGSGIAGSGANNIIIGHNISHSGNNTTIVGKDIVCQTSGNVGISIFGNNNTANEDYVSIFGNGNIASGLYALAVGYLNGVHGEYSVGVGENNLVLSDGSVAVGNNNSISGLSVDTTAFAFGIGNTIKVIDTGLALGYNNQIYGSGGVVIGNNIIASGRNNIVIGSGVTASGINNILISNTNAGSISGNNSIKLYANTGNYISISDSGVVIKSIVNNFTFDDIIVSGNASISGNATIYGNTITNGSFSNGGSSSFYQINASGSVNFLSTMNVQGNAQFQNLNASGTVNIGSNAASTGLYLTNRSVFSGLITAFSGINVIGSGSFSNGLIVGGTATFGNNVNISSLPYASSGSSNLLVYENNILKQTSNNFTTSTSGTASLSGTLNLLPSSAEYQFITAVNGGTHEILLPSGNVTYTGKRFTIVNRDASDTIYLKDAGGSTILEIPGGYNGSVVHAGSGDWIRLSYCAYGSITSVGN